VVDGHPAPGLADVGAQGGAAARGLEPEDAATGGRDADGAAAVVAVGDGDQARRHRRPRPSAGPARGAGEVPRVPGRPEESGLRIGHQPQFRRVGLAQDHYPRLAVAPDDFAIVVGDEVPEEAAAAAGGDASVVDQQVFQQEGDAPERPLGQPLLHLLAGEVIHRVDDGVDLGVDRLYAANCFFYQFRRGDFFSADPFSQSETIVVVILFETAHVSPFGGNCTPKMGGSQVYNANVIVHLLVKLGYNVGGNPFLREEERCGYSFVCPQ